MVSRTFLGDQISGLARSEAWSVHVHLKKLKHHLDIHISYISYTKVLDKKIKTGEQPKQLTKIDSVSSMDHYAKRGG